MLHACSAATTSAAGGASRNNLIAGQYSQVPLYGRQSHLVLT